MLERVEIVEVILDMRTFGNREAEVAENLDNLFPNLAHRMNVPCACGRWQCHVDFF